MNSVINYRIDQLKQKGSVTWGGEKIELDILESIGWIVAGFVPTFVSLQVAYIMGSKKSSSKTKPISPSVSR